ncbi:MAG TPA: glycosyltransferase [Kofleriaceae bacterium]|nr:glycosyltransferase [Kofleriaceae bacterium]
MTAPQVTVSIAARDRLPMLREAVASALAQDHDAFEVLVVDDGSGDETRDWLRALEASEPRARVVFAAHGGVAAARARGVAEARGEFVCILDSDDLLEPAALRRTTDVLASRADVALVYGNIRHLYADGTSRVRRYPRFTSNRLMSLATMVSPRVPFKHSGMTFRREVARSLGSYDPKLPSKIDIDLVLRFLAAGEKLELLDGEPIVAFRVHAGSMSRRRRAGLPVWFKLIDVYGPRSLALRAGMKAIRGGAEVLKEVYVAVRRE